MTDLPARVMKKLKAALKENLSKKQQRRVKKFVNSIRSVPFRNDLNKLASIYGSDKWGRHFYTQHYQNHLKRLKYKKIKLLEIGVGGYSNPYRGGSSLGMWKKYFPFAKIYAIDIHDKSFFQEDRINIFQGSQVDEGFLENVVRKSGALDVIIDDGSHMNDHVIRSFQFLFPKLKDGGIYIIEDTQTSYWKRYGGNFEDPVHAGTTLSFLKSLTDGLNHKEFPIPGYEPNYYDKKIVSMHFYHNMVFIYKGNNDEPSNLVDKHMPGPHQPIKS